MSLKKIDLDFRSSEIDSDAICGVKSICIICMMKTCLVVQFLKSSTLQCISLVYACKV